MKKITGFIKVHRCRWKGQSVAARRPPLWASMASTSWPSARTQHKSAAQGDMIIPVVITVYSTAASLRDETAPAAVLLRNGRLPTRRSPAAARKAEQEQGGEDHLEASSASSPTLKLPDMNATCRCGHEEHRRHRCRWESTSLIEEAAALRRSSIEEKQH